MISFRVKRRKLSCWHLAEANCMRRSLYSMLMIDTRPKILEIAYTLLFSLVFVQVNATHPPDLGKWYIMDKVHASSASSSLSTTLTLNTQGYLPGENSSSSKKSVLYGLCSARSRLPDLYTLNISSLMKVKLSPLEWPTSLDSIILYSLECI